MLLNHLRNVLFLIRERRFGLGDNGIKLLCKREPLALDVSGLRKPGSLPEVEFLVDDQRVFPVVKHAFGDGQLGVHLLPERNVVLEEVGDGEDCGIAGLRKCGSDEYQNEKYRSKDKFSSLEI